MKNTKTTKLLHTFRRQVADFIAEHVSSWKFIAGFTFSIVSWITLHKLGILTIDPDLSYCNFFLAWLAGIQASMVMQSEGRKEDNFERVMALHFSDTTKNLELSVKALDADLKNKELIKKMITKVNSLTQIIELIEKEKEKEEDGHGTRNYKNKASYSNDN